MNLRINQLDLPPEYTPEQLLKAAAKALHCAPTALSELKTIRRSIDARGRSPRMMVAVTVAFSGKLAAEVRNVTEVTETPAPTLPVGVPGSRARPIIVGAGPAGLMAALGLAEAGLKPILVERGEATAPRAQRVAAFWKRGDFEAESNVLYGEGGAGLFSDGKLTSRSKDRPRVRRFLEALVSCGASPDILIDAEPHLGSDVLEALVPALRERIQLLGGEVRFGVRLDRIEIEDGALRGVVLSGAAVETDCCVLATGHSARDVYTMLVEQGIPVEPKPFAVGLRMEIPQHRIDRAQWGGTFPGLGSANFRLTRREEGQARRCYTFCMCPGGLVISCASSPAELTTNGMSLSKRDLPFGNAAFLVPVLPEDFPAGVHPELAGMAFQREMEAAAFVAGGSDYGLPAQRLIEFLEGTTPSDLPATRSCTRALPAALHELLPAFVTETLRHAMPRMLREMRGVLLEEALVYASETRSSSPLRVLRGEDGQSTGLRGLYPCGEGAGYAGGIVSSGIDGLRISEAVVTNRTASATT
ncbi:MAG: FAD-dependent monooxygenase [Lentisphaerae bacterium]|nr:FAD-dependent monooxygenase [Lentisphaerota bacterium]